MLLERSLRNNIGVIIGKYFINSQDNINITKNGEQVVYQDLTVDDKNLLDTLIDNFEEGYNQIVDNQEVYEYGEFRLSRSVYNQEKITMDLRNALQEALERAYFSSGKLDYFVGNSETGEAITPSYSAQSIRQWDYTEKELQEMDWWILAEEILENLSIENDENEIYTVGSFPR